MSYRRQQPIIQFKIPLYREDGVYNIDAGAGEVSVFCVLSGINGCGSGGFTLVMKLDGKKASVR